MSIDQQLPRASIIWLLLVQLAVIVPHISRMPWWVLVIWLLCALWRLAMFRGQAQYPGRIVRTVIALLAVVGVAISFGSLEGLDISAALLIVAFCLKIIEVRKRRDLTIVFFLAFFVIATSFLFSQSLWLAIYQCLAVVMTLVAMVLTHHARTTHTVSHAFRMTGRLCLQAAPIALVLFLVFPRIPPLWSVASADNSAGTGMSDTMAPGDVSRLNRSARLAFTVNFETEIPPARLRYWRGMSLSEFDGRSWSASPEAKSYIHTQSIVPDLLVGEPVRYRMLVEPNDRQWLFTLPVAVAGENRTANPQVYRTADYTLRAAKPIDERRMYSLVSYLDSARGVWISDRQRQLNLALPNNYNPRAMALARQMRRQVDDDSAFVRSIQMMIRDGDYYYTLEPPTLGYHSVDEFLFESRRGFCEHYSSAAVVMLRAAGIPSRVVIGYQGGEYNSINNTLTVRDFDAHAWAEYWVEGQGWQRFDPTASVAPERINLGMQDALVADQRIERSIFSPLYYRNLPLVKSLRQQAEAINFAWQRMVVNFDQQKQVSILETLLGKVSAGRTALLVVAVIATSVLMAGLRNLLLNRRDREPQYIRDYRRFVRKLSSAGVMQRTGETTAQFARRAARSLPVYRQAIERITALFQRLAYATPGDSETADSATLSRAVRRFSPSRSVRPRKKAGG